MNMSWMFLSAWAGWYVQLLTIQIKNDACLCWQRLKIDDGFESAPSIHHYFLSLKAWTWVKIRRGRSIETKVVLIDSDVQTSFFYTSSYYWPVAVCVFVGEQEWGRQRSFLEIVTRQSVGQPLDELVYFTIGRNWSLMVASCISGGYARFHLV